MTAPPEMLSANPPIPPGARPPSPPAHDPAFPPSCLRASVPSCLLPPLLSSDLPLHALAKSLDLSLADLAAAFRSPESRETLAILAEIEDIRTRFRAEQGRRTAIATLELVATTHADLTERRRAAASILRIASATLRDQRPKPPAPDAPPTAAPPPSRTQGFQSTGSHPPPSAPRSTTALAELLALVNAAPAESPSSAPPEPHLPNLESSSSPSCLSACVPSSLPPPSSSPSEITSAFLSACQSDPAAALAIGFAFNEAPDPADPGTPEDFDDYADRFESDHADLLLGLKHFTLGTPEPLDQDDALPPDLVDAAHVPAQVTTAAGRTVRLRFEFIKPRQGPNANLWRLGPIHEDST